MFDYTDCFVLRTPTILPYIRISWSLRSPSMLMYGRVPRSRSALCKSKQT